MDIEEKIIHPLSTKWQFLYRSPQKKGVVQTSAESGTNAIYFLGEVNSLESLVLYDLELSLKEIN